MKSTEDIRRKAGSLQQPLVEFFRRQLGSGYGDEIEQLRVVGYLCEVMLGMVEEELKMLKAQEGK